MSQVRTATTDDGAQLRVSVVSEERDEVSRRQTTLLRHEHHHDATSTVEDRPWVMHWHTRTGFEALVEAAGLRVVSVTDTDGSPAVTDATDLHFQLQDLR